MAVMQGLDSVQVRHDFPFFRKGLIYLDSAATSQKPKEVLTAIIDFYERENANVHRGIYRLAEKATERYEEARKTVAKFIGAHPCEIVFVRNATEAINVVARSFGESVVKSGSTILLTEMEHHSNILPWQLLAKRKGAKIEVVPITDSGEIELGAVSSALAKKPALFAFTHVSNVLGTINPAKEFILAAKKQGVPVLVDASQSVPSMPVDVKEIGCDFLVFSGHKMLGPHVGVLYAKRELLDKMEPFLVGGGMVKSVDWEGAVWKESPEKFEAGTVDVPSAVGLAAAVEYLKKIGMEKVMAHEQALAQYACEQLSQDESITMYGPKERINVVSFNVGDMHAHDVATVLDEEGICVRAGHHCAHPLMKRLGIPACVRASFGVYNTKEDVDALVAAIKKAKKVFRI